MKIYILGGGPAGCSAAYFLKKKGFSDITIVEKGSLGGCARTNFYDNIPYEFGPQVMYTDEDRIRKVFEEFVEQYPPPTVDGKFHPALSIDGKLNEGSVHDFPVSISNILKLPDPEQAIFELYQLNLEKPDYSSFENYVISRMGKTIYELFVKNYNIKQWKFHPRDMDAEWAKFRNLTLKPKTHGMFGDKWQGHPGNHNPIWEGMTKGVKVESGEAKISEDFRTVTINGDKVKADLVISTLPLSERLEFINTCKVYVVIKTDKFLMPSYINSFPNNYNFTRIMEYKQQFYVDSDYALLDFAFPWIGELQVDDYIEEAKWFVKNILKKEVAELWIDSRETTYPVSTRKNLDLVNEKLKEVSDTNVVPLGRSGVHAYVSKDTCIRMAYIMHDGFDDILAKGEKKYSVLLKMREKLT